MPGQFKIGDKVWVVKYKTIVKEAIITDYVEKIGNWNIKYKLNISKIGSYLDEPEEVYHFDLWRRPNEKEDLIDHLESCKKTLENSIESMSE